MIIEPLGKTTIIKFQRYNLDSSHLDNSMLLSLLYEFNKLIYINGWAAGTAQPVTLKTEIYFILILFP